MQDVAESSSCRIQPSAKVVSALVNDDALRIEAALAMPQPFAVSTVGWECLYGFDALLHYGFANSGISYRNRAQSGFPSSGRSR